MAEQHKKGASKAQTEKEQKEHGSIHAPQKVAYPTEHDPKVNKWLRLAQERAKKQA